MAPRRVVLDAVVGEPRRCRDRQALVDARDRIQRYRLSAAGYGVPRQRLGRRQCRPGPLGHRRRLLPLSPQNRDQGRKPRSRDRGAGAAPGRTQVRSLSRHPGNLSAASGSHGSLHPYRCRRPSPANQGDLSRLRRGGPLLPAHHQGTVSRTCRLSRSLRVASLGGCRHPRRRFCLSIGGIDTAQGTQARTPRGMKTSIPRIAAAAALVVLGIWAGAWVYSTHSAAPRHHGVPVPAGVASAPNPSDLAHGDAAPPDVAPDGGYLPGPLPASKIPDRLPQFALADRAGKATSIASFGGKSLIINFWATWCAPCRSEIPLLETLHSEWAGREVSVVGIAVDYRDKVLEFADRFKIAYPLLIGEKDALDAAPRN